MSQYDPNLEEGVDSKTDVEVDEPPMYKVMLLNDDYTTMDFATLIMLNVHRKGVGVCGTYPYEIAETKVNLVESLARENGFPLKCIMERE